MDLGEPLQITQQIAEVFEKLNIQYLIGGSLASSLHGIPRATQDVDIVAALKTVHVTDLVNSLQSDFYIDKDMITNAIHRRSSFNIIHLNTMFKVDIFILKENEGALEEMSRRQSYSLNEEGMTPIFLASAEDIIVQKLKWYKMGNRISERQWLDVLGVLQVQKDQLDYDYLKKAADRTNITDLLSEAIKESENK